MPPPVVLWGGGLPPEREAQSGRYPCMWWFWRVYGVLFCVLELAVFFDRGRHRKRWGLRKGRGQGRAHAGYLLGAVPSWFDLLCAVPSCCHSVCFPRHEWEGAAWGESASHHLYHPSMGTDNQGKDAVVQGEHMVKPLLGQETQVLLVWVSS